jgi:hypothetical protein
LTGALLGQHDVLDVPLDVVPGQPPQRLVAQFAIRLGGIQGHLEVPPGTEAPAYTVVLFSVDEEYWTVQSRRVASTRPDSSGAFAINDVPDGAYYVGVVTDVEPGKLGRPELLRDIAPAAVRVLVTEGATVSQDVRILP